MAPRQTQKYIAALTCAQHLGISFPQKKHQDDLYQELAAKGYGWDRDTGIWSQAAANPVTTARAQGAADDDLLRIRIMGDPSALQPFADGLVEKLAPAFRLIERSGEYKNRKPPMHHVRVYLTFLKQ